MPEAVTTTAENRTPMRGEDRDTIADMGASENRAAFRERILQTRNGMLDHAPFCTHAFDADQREEFMKLHHEGHVELKAMASWNPPVWRSLTDYEIPEEFWAVCDRREDIMIRIVVATNENNAKAPEEQRAAWDEINARFIAGAPGQKSAPR